MTGPFFRSRSFVLCFLANLLQATGFSLFLHFPGFLQRLGADAPVIGFVEAAAALASVAASPFVGRALDASGRRRVLLGGSALTVLLCGGFLLVTSLGPAVALLRMLHGAAGMALHVALFTCAVDLVPDARRSQGLALFGISSMGAIGLGALLGDAVFGLGGYDAVFLASLVLSLAAALLALGVPETRGHAHLHPSTPGRWVDVLGQRTLLGVWILTAAFFFAMTSVFVYMKTWVVATGIGSVGLFFALYSGTAIVVRLLLGGIPDRVGAAAVAGPTLLVYASGLVLMSAADATPWFASAAVICGVGHGYGYPVLLTLITERAGDGQRGVGVAMYGAIDDGAAFVAAPLLGYVIDLAGYDAMFLTAGGLVLAAVAAFRWRENQPGRRAT